MNRLTRLSLTLVITFALFPAMPVLSHSPRVVQAAKPATKQAGKPLDINTATEEQLKSIQGIGNAYSTKIIEGRPYKRKDDLVKKKIVPQATYDTIKDNITVR
jgi:competence protein ComEA